MDQNVTLLLALQNNNEIQVETILKKNKCNPNDILKFNEFFHELTPSIFLLLIKYGLDVNQIDETGCTLLMRLAFRPSTQSLCLANILLNYGATIFNEFRPKLNIFTFCTVHYNDPLNQLLIKTATERQLFALLMMHTTKYIQKNKLPIDLIKFLSIFLI